MRADASVVERGEHSTEVPTCSRAEPVPFSPSFLLFLPPLLPYSRVDHSPVRCGAAISVGVVSPSNDLDGVSSQVTASSVAVDASIVVQEVTVDLKAGGDAATGHELSLDAGHIAGHSVAGLGEVLAAREGRAGEE